MSFLYLSVCSGLEGASLAFEGLGATPVGFSEIEAFPSAIIAHRYGSNFPGDDLSRNAPPNFGDFTTIPLERLGRVDVLIGGTPCQAFSIAGKRLSLADARGNLTLSYAVLAHELARSHGLRNAIWENVPGCLSTEDNAFGCFLGALVGADDALLPCARPGRGKSNAFWRWRPAERIEVRDEEGNPTGEIIDRPELHVCLWPSAGMVAGPRARAAWRVLDAQYFGLAQRRERVFLVADFGNGADPVKVLFEPKGVRGNLAPRRKKGEGVAPTIAARTRGGGGFGTDFDCDGGLIAAPIEPTLNAHFGEKQGLENQHIDGGCGMFVAHALRAEGFDASEDGTGRGTPIVPVYAIQERAVSENPNAGPQGSGIQENCAYTLEARHHVQAVAFSCKDHGADMPHSESHPNAGGQLAVAFDLRGREGGAQFEGPHDTANIRAASGGSSRSYVAERWAVRRLTPIECERLQGVPDGYTAIPWRGKDAGDCPDGPRYKALGNSWAVPVVRWIAERLARELKLIEFDSVFGPPEAWK